MAIDQDGVVGLLEELYLETDDKKKEIVSQKLLAMDDEGIKYIFFPPKKYLWEVSASILSRVGFPRLHQKLPLLLEWYQDANWPGREKITEMLQKVNKVDLARHIEESIRRADFENDEQWIGGLKYLINDLNIDLKLFKEERLVKLILNNDY